MIDVPVSLSETETLLKMNTRNLHIPSNKVCDIERYFYSELDSLYEPGEIRQFVLMLFEAYLGWDQVRFLLNRQSTINQSDLLRFHWAVEHLKDFRPIQYIIGSTTFCGCRIEVSDQVLIPRPETEEIVDWVGQNLNPRSVLDLCTGSGCIAIALAVRFPQAHVIGADVSDEALDVARRNAAQNGVQAEFFGCDVLKAPIALPDQKYDLIVSNPPYIAQSERVSMAANVLDYEPELALFVPDEDPLRFYRAISEYAQDHLSEGGSLVFEINEHYGSSMLQLLRSYGFRPSLHQDFRGKDRMVVAVR